jgi:hypothetical protein
VHDTVDAVSKAWSCFCLVALCMAPASASARKQGELSYAYDKVWNTALRMVRVDLRLPVTDRDPEAGYLLFDYIDHDKRYPGSIELVRAERDRRTFIRAVVQVNGMPSYVEQMAPIEPPKPVKPAPPAEHPDEPKPEQPAEPSEPAPSAVE